MKCILGHHLLARTVCNWFLSSVLASPRALHITASVLFWISGFAGPFKLSVLISWKYMVNANAAIVKGQSPQSEVSSNCIFISKVVTRLVISSVTGNQFHGHAKSANTLTVLDLSLVTMSQGSRLKPTLPYLGQCSFWVFVLRSTHCTWLGLALVYTGSDWGTMPFSQQWCLN